MALKIKGNTAIDAATGKEVESGCHSHADLTRACEARAAGGAKAAVPPTPSAVVALDFKGAKSYVKTASIDGSVEKTRQLAGETDEAKIAELLATPDSEFAGDPVTVKAKLVKDYIRDNATGIAYPNGGWVVLEGDYVYVVAESDFDTQFTTPPKG